MYPIEMDRFDSVVERIRIAFPDLRIDVRRETPHVHAVAEVPVQPGLNFRLSLSLQNADELHLNAGDHFWVEWFPVGKHEVFDQFGAAAVGLIAGDYRIVESYLFGRAVMARLERPKPSGGWETIATWSNLGHLIPWPGRRKVIQNKVA
jgi:hypothetical protein